MEENSIYYNLDAEMSVLGLAVSYPNDCLRKVTSLPTGIMYVLEDQKLLECLKAMEREKAKEAE